MSDPVQTEQKPRRTPGTQALLLLTALLTAAVVGLLVASSTDRQATMEVLAAIRPVFPYLLVLFVVFVVTVFFVPPFAVWTRMSQLRQRLDAEKRMVAEDSLRTALFQAAGSALLVLGFVGTGLQLDQTNQQNRDQLALARNGQVAERFSRAMEHLASDNRDVRIGGIYALESLLEELAVEPRKPYTGDEEDRQVRKRAIASGLEILIAYVHNHAPRSDPTLVREPLPQSDVQAVMNILGRQSSKRTTRLVLSDTDLRGYRLTGCLQDDENCPRYDLGDVEFSRSDLRGAEFYRASMVGAIFRLAKLDEARMTGADLKNAKFVDADLPRALLASANLAGAIFVAADLTAAQLTEAVMDKANLGKAKLVRADLTGAMMVEADLGEADLAEANLAKADLAKAVFSKANLWGADLSLAKNLDQAILIGACANVATKWPPNFDPRAAGVIIEPGPTSSCRSK